MESYHQYSSPVALVKAFLACVESKDIKRMETMFHTDATACLIRDNEPRYQTLATAVDRLLKAEQHFVEVTWDEVEHVDGDFATVWSKFSIHQDGELLQLGSNSFTCWNAPLKGWIILAMTDIARTQSVGRA